jgi:tetratricopeptide (TPR) repeat protein
MPSPFETELRDLLSDLRDPRAVAEDLVRRWNMRLLGPDEQKDAAQFFLSAGLYGVFFDQIRTICDGADEVPWAQLAEAVGRAKIKPTDKELDAIFEGAKAQNALSDLVRSHQLDLWSRKFSEHRSRIQHLRAKDLEAKKQELKDKLQFMRSNRLVDQEAELLKEAEAMFPSDLEMKSERESFEMRWARDVIARAGLAVESPEPEDLERRAERLTPEQIATRDLIVERAKEVAAANANLAYDLALALHFMEFHTDAIEILNHVPESTPSIDWLRLDLMIFARLFVDALSEATRLEELYADDPESAFAATYARAHALKGLGQDEMAVDLLRGLVRVRPGYKSAQSFLMDWSGGDE